MLRFCFTVEAYQPNGVSKWQLYVTWLLPRGSTTTTLWPLAISMFTTKRNGYVLYCFWAIIGFWQNALNGKCNVSNYWHCLLCCMADSCLHMFRSITLGFSIGWSNHVPAWNFAWFLHLGSLMKTYVEQFQHDMAEHEYCAYCLEAREGRQSCCHENHWIPLKDFEERDQLSIIQYEYHTAFGKEMKWTSIKSWMRPVKLFTLQS